MKRIALLLSLAFALTLSVPASATISTLASQITVAGTGSQTVFQFPFTVGSVNEITLIYTNASGAQTTIPPSQYLVALNPITVGNLWPIGGSVTYPISSTPIAAGTTLTIQRVLPLIQATNLSNQGNFYPAAVEEGLDTGVMQTQQVSAKNGTLRGTWLAGTLYNYGDIVSDGVNGANTGNLYACAIPNTSVTWATDLAKGDWVLALNIQGIVNFNPNINNNYLFANISGGSASPYGVSGTAYLDSTFGSTQGNILYRNASTWTVLPPGTNGQVLTSGGSSSNVSWTSASGSGTITSVTAGTGLSGGGSTGGVTLSIATIANNSIFANVTGGVAAPGATTLSAILDSVLGNTQGSIIYRAGTMWAELTPGSSGQVLTSQGSAANPIWSGASISANTTGYTSIPGGIIEEWGTASTNGSGIATLSLPLTCPTGFLNSVVSSNVDTDNIANATGGNTTTATATVRTTGGGAVSGQAVNFFVVCH